jgi:hypothetical protein
VEPTILVVAGQNGFESAKAHTPGVLSQSESAFKNSHVQK